MYELRTKSNCCTKFPSNVILQNQMSNATITTSHHHTLYIIKSYIALAPTTDAIAIILSLSILFYFICIFWIRRNLCYHRNFLSKLAVLKYVCKCVCMLLENTTYSFIAVVKSMLDEYVIILPLPSRKSCM